MNTSLALGLGLDLPTQTSGLQTAVGRVRLINGISLQGNAIAQIRPPQLDLREESPARRVRIHLLQIALAGLTIFFTAWCYQLHIALGLSMTFLAKHILVALLAAGLRLPIRETEK